MIRDEEAGPEKIVEQYPADGWRATLNATASGARIGVAGSAKDRLLVLE